MLQARAISKTYESAAGPVPVLENVELDLRLGDALSIMGPSGSGKSTLLHILGMLDPPTSGELHFDGVEPWTLKETEQARFRNSNIGFVFQDHCLLPQCTVIENVLTPTLIGERDENMTIRAKELIDRAGLTPRIDHFPAQLSGGEKQRVAIARALIRRPKLLLCDEPTGNLDEETAWQVLGLLADFQQEMQSILVIVTHSPAIASEFPQRFEMHGRHLRKKA
ncbi:MAG: ABC transporter ATP-binding protein [Acidobacteria bacterium]|nr:ABC transporter ATP-binding protein [Acidobacteriota bacterium]